MSNDEILAGVRDALCSIEAPRMFETERGFQGELIARLHARLKLQAPAVIEQEYQKQLGRHGLKIRPDIILHEPFDEQVHPGRNVGNLAVIELKRRASSASAAADLDSLAQMIRVLGYPLGIFINIDADETFAAEVPEDVRDRVVAFAVRLEGGKVHLREARK